MWGGFYEIDIDFSKLLWVQLLRYLLGFLFIIVLVVAAVTIKRKKAEKMRNLKNLQRVEGYFEEISNRILNLEDKAKFLRLLNDGQNLENKFEEVTINFKNLKEYYEGIKNSYSDSEFKTFLTIYNILKSDLDFLEKVLKDSEKTLQEELEYIEKVKKAVDGIKNKEVLKKKIDELFAKRVSDDDLKKAVEGIKRIDEKIEYFKSLDDEKKSSYINTMIQLLTKRFEEKYPLILSKSSSLALQLQKKFDDLLLKLQVSSDSEKIVLTEDFLEKLLQVENELAQDFQKKMRSKKDLVDKFEKIVSVYDKVGFKFYKVDLEIERVKNLLESCADNEKLEKEISELESVILTFTREFSECKKLLENFERFLKEAKNRLKVSLSSNLFDSYYKNLKELFYECNFDEFKKRYIEYQNDISDALLKSTSFSTSSSDTIKKVIKDLFDEFFR
ncbi:hypothetical protein B0S90_0484 [Caldicellulosiruptor bescii]|uniref:Uncharacterized protein n=2 Tax=Caldicellulosiruptor bescii TaxID=31899 RepID=B9MMD4_CALBD|nr:hypothetical protein [Caldicellulosiruptor bescii]ACM59366.1 conserved hypothetical protein [Caldicellulosiruptor bescii DSM 6725]PBC88177.1 hypothetical protein B0S87_1141 [Caldicellulosiruptor bescii]PBC92342.1 hypothetical protein B0S89_2852 [Caldicellulosiruptor bescii]PBD04847.1 hypothetical protein B0S85_2556 [Caldicellulosiruptor bescii]PBD05523.1 hypothetical protein B0S90_0484 [Caldicellulosiruptor bescii]